MMQQYQTMTEGEPVHPGLEALEDAFCTVDPQWRVTYWNASAERMLGVDRQRILGRDFWAAVPFFREGPAWEQLRAVAAGGGARRFLEACPPGPAAGFLSIYAAPLPQGGLAVQIRNATEEVQREDQYSALLESIHDGFIAVDDQWSIVYLNTVAESLLRFSRDQAVGLSLWSLLPRGPDVIRDCLRATMSDGIQRHLREVQPEGRVFRGRVFDLWTFPLAGGGISLLFEDVSERVQRERELAHYAAEADEANRAKSRFFAAVSHELRTPLNAIVGYTHLLATGAYGKMPEGAQRAADRTGVCAEHLSRLVDDVLVLTTSEIGRLPVAPVPVQLDSFLPTMLEPHRLQAEAKGLRFELSIDDEVPMVETDPQRLRQLLVGLLSNAVKFTSRGAVRVECRAALADGGEPGAYSLFPESQVEIRVADTGPGVSAEDRERIFDAFEQLGDPARSQSMSRGTGLGLTIARQLAHLLGGTLYLAESSADGSCFCLRLPLRPPSSTR